MTVPTLDAAAAVESPATVIHNYCVAKDALRRDGDLPTTVRVVPAPCNGALGRPVPWMWVVKLGYPARSPWTFPAGSAATARAVALSIVAVLTGVTADLTALDGADDE